MARFGAWSPLAANWAAQPRLTTPDIICLHTMVGSLAGTDAMFRRNGYGGTFSHFGIGGDGSCIQWQDTAFRAAANYNGNHRIISVECADMGAPFAPWNTNDGSAVPAFSDAQLTTLAELFRTIAPAHNIPIVLIPDALPGRRGIGYHRLGVPGYMAPGAEQWSTAPGKVCPGYRRIAQIPQVIELATGADMPLTQADANLVAQAVITAALQSKNDPRGAWGLQDRLPAVDKGVSDLYAQILGTGPGTLNGDLRADLAAKAQQLQAVLDGLGKVQTPTVDAAAVAAALTPDQLAAMGRAAGDRLADRAGNGH